MLFPFLLALLTTNPNLVAVGNCLITVLVRRIICVALSCKVRYWTNPNHTKNYAGAKRVVRNPIRPSL